MSDKLTPEQIVSMPLRAFISFPQEIGVTVFMVFGASASGFNALAGIYFISTGLFFAVVFIIILVFVSMPLRAFISFPHREIGFEPGYVVMVSMPLRAFI